MVYSAVVETLDRLSVKSVSRGSTSTVCSLLGTLAVIILCLAIYIPPIQGYFKGNYFQSEFYLQNKVDNTFYSDQDFKVAIQFRSRKDNSVPNHQKLLQWAYSYFGMILADYSASYTEPSLSCQSDYFSNAINPVQLQDCFLFPHKAQVHMFADWGVITDYTAFYHDFLPKPDNFPFRASGSFFGNQELMNSLVKDYYMVVYFTSKIIDPRSGKPQFQVNKFYTTSSNFQLNGGNSLDLIVYNIKKYHQDISIMPWVNNVTTSTLVWQGQQYTYSENSPETTAQYGMETAFSLYNFNIESYMYYKKLDWLLGIIGGAMLLFYIILWIPCTYINRTLHQMNNVNQLLLINHSTEGEPLTENNVTAANVSNWYWLSNPILDNFVSSCKTASKLVFAADQQLDIVRLVKKLKVVERTLRKKSIMQQFKPKILNMKSQQTQEEVEMESRNEEISSNMNEPQNNHPQLEIVDEVIEDDVIELPVDGTFGLLDSQLERLKDDQQLPKVYENNMTFNVISNNRDETNRLKQIQNRSKFKANYPKKAGKVKTFIRALTKVIKFFDLFSVRPNLLASNYGSSLLGCFNVLIIITLSILTFALTLSNANIRQIMILNNVLPNDQVDYTLNTGTNLKFALCFDRAADLKGSSKKANLRFFTQSKVKGRTYITPTQLSTSDYKLFDYASSADSPINLNYCFGLPVGYPVLMNGEKNQYGYFGFRVQPFCSSTPSYCALNAQTINNNFLTFINNTYTYLFLPENRFDPNTTKFINNLIHNQLNINYNFLKSGIAFQETIFIDQVKISDDTKNWFMRKEAETVYQGISSNQNTPYPLSRNIQGSTYYEVKIKPSNNQIQYFVTTPKADTLLGIIGGVFVLWYALLHWLGKLYNSFKVRCQLAYQIYDQESINESPLNKLLTIFPIPLCLIPSCYHIKGDVIRMRQIEKKIKHDLSYLWLVKNVDNLYQLSSAFFQRIQAKNLSLIYIKQKIDENQLVRPPIEQIQRVSENDFYNLEVQEEQPRNNGNDNEKNYNRVLNETAIPANSKESNANLNEYDNEKMLPILPSVDDNGENEKFQDNFIHGAPKQPRFNWLDTFEYPASLTFKGHREISSFCGGCCCLIMLLFVIIIASFEVGVYLNRSDMRVGMTTSMMQPLNYQQNSTFNNQLLFVTGQNFKLGVTFSKLYQDYPNYVGNWTNSAVGISVFQQIFTIEFGTKYTQTSEFPLVPCPSDYFTTWLNDLTDKNYFLNSQYGYCMPNGMTLEIDGLPDDKVTKRFTLSIFNKLGTDAGNQEVKAFMQLYLPKFHFSNAVPDMKNHKFNYQMTSLTFDSFNITKRVSQNISASKTIIYYDDQIAFQGDPYVDIAYAFSPFHKFQTAYYDTEISRMSYNLSFANSYQVEYYTVQGDKFYETFGIIGGLVALFIFGLGCFARSFNYYRMKYLVGKELYLFDMLKKREARALARGKKRKTKQELRSLSEANSMNEAQILLAYLLSFIAAIAGNYNINTTLRRVTLIQRKVEQDLDICSVYKKIHLMRDIINRELQGKDSQERSVRTPLTNIFLKHIYDPEPDQSIIVGQPKILAFAKKHSWSTFEQLAVFDASRASINLKQVFDNAFLERELHMENVDRTQIHLSQFGGTQGSVGTSSVIEPSQLQRQEEEER